MTYMLGSSIECSGELLLLMQYIASNFMLLCLLLLSCFLRTLGKGIDEDILPNLSANTVLQLANFYTKIFNPKLEDALFCIEYSFQIVDTNPSESDVEKAPNKTPKNRNVNHQQPDSNETPSFSYILSMPFSVAVWFNLNPYAAALSCIAFIFRISKTNLLESDVGRGPHKSPQESTINQQPFTDVFLELLKAAVWLITKMIYDNFEDTVSSTESSSAYDNNVGLTESNVRGPNKPPKKSTNSHHQPSSNQGHTKYFHESNVRDYGRTNDNCSHDSYHASVAMSQMTTVPTVAVHPRDMLLKCKNFAGGDYDRDNSHVVPKSDLCNANPFQSNLVGGNDCHSSSNQTLAKSSIPSCGTSNSKTTTMYSMSTSQTLKGTPPLVTGDSSMKMSVKSTLQETAENSLTVSAYNECYKKLTYAVLVGNTVRTCNTKLYASLPLQNKYMVKQRVQDSSGATKIRLVLKSSYERHSCLEETKQSETHMHSDDLEIDGNGQKVHYHRNYKKAGYIVYSCDGSFHGDIKYPLPSGKATNSKIGRGGNGFVFIIYHGKRQYAVKQTVYRSNEVNVHSALSHENILPLLAVLMGEKHETHSGRLYCYHFMPKMDYDLRQILSTKEVGCLKYLYRRCLTDQAKFDRAFNNVKFILKKTLKALSYIHSSGFVHRDVKASNIMIKMNCKCNPLYCDCVSKFRVRLGDFDSAGTIPGLGIKEPTDQMIKFASILPLGTPGYRAPEVSMHIVLSGPYETLYTTAVDMWSFGCLFLNICIGKTAALKQREEALLLLSTNKCFEELWIKTSKIQELEKTQPFSHDTKLLYLIRSCLRVDYNKRLSATDAQTCL